MAHSNEKAKSVLSKKFDQKLNEEIIAKQKELIDGQKERINKLTEGLEKQRRLIDLMKTKIVALTELISLHEEHIRLLKERIDTGLPEDFVRNTEPITNDTTCAICLEEVLSMSRDMVILNCSHRFHFSCLRQCIRKLCPVCRVAF